MNPNTKLSLEQEFNLKHFSTQVERMSREQAQEFLVKMREQMMVQENLYRKLLKHEWKIDSDFLG
jgi:hypothetical protein